MTSVVHGQLKYIIYLFIYKSFLFSPINIKKRSDQYKTHNFNNYLKSKKSDSSNTFPDYISCVEINSKIFHLSTVGFRNTTRAKKVIKFMRRRSKNKQNGLDNRDRQRKKTSLSAGINRTYNEFKK